MGKKLELTGQKFNKLTVIREYGKDKKGNITWLCKCDCGNFKIVTGKDLKSNQVKSCGCREFRDLSGQKFGKLTVVKFAYKNKNSKIYWECLCDCGNTKIVRQDSLIGNVTISCGCHRLNILRKQKGLSNTVLYDKRLQMIDRCYNPKCKEYRLYGERGIKVCKLWRDSFLEFYNWSINNGYKEGLSLDRIDVNGNYEPNNCRYVTQKEQCRNKRNNRYIEFKGIRKSLASWAEELNVPYSRLITRLNRGWSVEDAFKYGKLVNQYGRVN